VERAFVLGGEGVTREWGYTALSRARAETRLYLVGGEPLREVLAAELGGRHEQDSRDALEVGNPDANASAPRTLTLGPSEASPMGALLDQGQGFSHGLREKSSSTQREKPCQTKLSKPFLHHPAHAAHVGESAGNSCNKGLLSPGTVASDTRSFRLLTELSQPRGRRSAESWCSAGGRSPLTVIAACQQESKSAPFSRNRKCTTSAGPRRSQPTQARPGGGPAGPDSGCHRDPHLVAANAKRWRGPRRAASGS
jgi:hypothetical protein